MLRGSGASTVLQVWLNCASPNKVGSLTSDDVTQDRLDIRGYIDTARKHGRNAMDVLCDLMTGNPWRPPAQAFSP